MPQEGKQGLRGKAPISQAMKEQLLKEEGWEKIFSESGSFLGWYLPKKPPFMVVTEEYALNWLRNQLKKQ